MKGHCFTLFMKVHCFTSVMKCHCFTLFICTYSCFLILRPYIPVSEEPNSTPVLDLFQSIDFHVYLYWVLVLQGHVSKYCKSLISLFIYFIVLRIKIYSVLSYLNCSHRSLVTYVKHMGYVNVRNDINNTIYIY